MRDCVLARSAVGALLPIAMLLCAACSSVRGMAPMDIDQSSPANVARAYREASENRRFDVMLACVEPAKQAQFDSLLVVAKEYSDQVLTVGDLIRDKFGDEQADEFVQMTGRVLALPFEQAEEDGRVNWARISFDVQGDTAELLLDGKSYHAEASHLKRIDGKWYIAKNDRETSSTPSVDTAVVRAFYGPGMKRLRMIENYLRNDDINEEDVWELLLVNEGEPRGGAVVQGMQIEISTIRGPVFRQRTVPANPLIFSVTASHALSQGAPICWSMPSMGLGEGIVVKIDGEEIAQPQHARDVVRSLRPDEHSGYSVTWWIALPPEVKLERGMHTIQYTLTSAAVPAGELASPDMSVLEGALESNVLRFLVRRGGRNRAMGH